MAAVEITAREGDGSVTIQVTLDRSLVVEAALHYATQDGSATAGSDYEPASGRLVFAAGATEASFDVTLLDDDQPEAAETILIALSDPEGPLALGVADAVLTIEDDDGGEEAYRVYLPLLIR